MMNASDNLIAAACSGDVAWVRRILQADPAQVHARDSHIGTTPLHCAAHRGFLEIVHALLDAGADIMSRESCSDTIPLHWAAEGGHLEVARLLVDQGSGVDALDSWHNLGPIGWATVIQHAHGRNPARYEVAEFLLNHGARLDIFSAIVWKDPDTVRRMIEADPDMLSQQLGVVDKGQQPLHFAVINNLPDMAQLLLDVGADINAKTAWGLTPLCLAVMMKHDQIVDMLRARPADVDLSAALALGQFDRAKELIDADSNLVGPGGPYRLLAHFTAQRGLAEATAVLLSNGADPNVIAEHFYHEREIVCSLSPLHVAAWRGHEDVARILVDHGANLQSKDDRYESTPFVWAKWHHHDAVAALLK
ncbi:MAG TPA: ankyrin repeat domain-containing protein [Blastocatellia bacterium]|jgi:ankyrin repeat protein|nr:ankyrin repeat domain-containing protein [Blastocatellia bacterium]